MTKRITDFSTVIEFFFCNEMEEKKKFIIIRVKKWKIQKKSTGFNRRIPPLLGNLSKDENFKTQKLKMKSKTWKRKVILKVLESSRKFSLRRNFT